MNSVLARPGQKYVNVNDFDNNSTYTITVKDSRDCITELMKGPIMCSEDSNPCCDETPVYPGDLNHDGIVNHVDHGMIGLYKTEIGSGRTQEHQNTDWYPHPTQDWGTQQLNNEDIKHFDCNGDGFVDDNDWQAVHNNMDSTWTTPMLLPPPPGQSDYQVMLYPRAQISESFLIMNIALERRAGGNLTTQGGYFTIDYSFIEDSIDYVTLGLLEESWLGRLDDNLSFETNEIYGQKKIEIGFTKTDRMNSTGSGVIGDLIVSLNTGLRLAKTSNNMYEFQITNIGTHNGIELTPIEDQVLQIDLNNNDCQAVWTINEDTPLKNQYKSSNLVETDGFLIIGKDQYVEYKADRIHISSGFKIKAGASFKAGYSNCSSTSNCDPLFADYPPLTNYLNPNTCINETVEECYDGSNYYFLYILNVNKGELYLYNNGTLSYYGNDAGDKSLPVIYGMATGRMWACGC